MTRFGYDIETEGKEEDTFGPSKTQVKGEMLDLQELGVALLDLPFERLTRLPMTEALHDALRELQRITTHGARRRQAAYIGKLLRDVDADVFRNALDEFRRGQEQASRGFPDVAKWRDRLLIDDAALTEWFAAYPTGDTRQLRTLIRSARQEEADAQAESQHTGEPASKGRHYRALFQHLRAALLAHHSDLDTAD